MLQNIEKTFGVTTERDNKIYFEIVLIGVLSEKLFCFFFKSTNHAI